MKAVITGATGFIGKNLCARLIRYGADIICTGRSLGKLGRLRDKVRPVYLDICDKNSVTKLVKEQNPDIVFHCAALVMSNSLKHLMRVNAEGTRNVLGACLESGVKKVVYLSSIAVISANKETVLTDKLPYAATNNYGISKIEAEKIALNFRNKGLNIVILRPPPVYGESEPHMLPILIKLIRYRLLPVLGDGNARFHMAAVDNVVDVMMLALENERLFEGTYIIADSQALAIKDILHYIAKTIDAPRPLQLPKSIIHPFTLIPVAGRRLKFFLKDRVYSIDKLKMNLGYIPRISVYDGLRRAVESCVSGKY